MKRYKVKLDCGETFTLLFDGTQSSAPVLWVDEFGDQQPTPYQTADARHCEFEAAEAILRSWQHHDFNGAYTDVMVESVEEED